MIMRKVAAICLNTFRESVRDKVFYSLLAFALLILGFSVVLGSLSLGDTYKIIQDFGLMAISLFGTLTAIFVGIGMVYKEMEKRTAYVILAKPIARWQFLLGKYCGLSLTLAVMEVFMIIGLFAVCYLYKEMVPYRSVYALVGIFFELQLILATAVLFSTFTTPFLSGLFTLSAFIVGHITADLKIIAESMDASMLKTIMKTMYYVLPNLERLNFKAAVVHRLEIPAAVFSTAIIYSIGYTAMIILCSVLIFNRRDMR
jgi:ABC-type transport system involved in multi-copper enzyme maturation permease subunit